MIQEALKYFLKTAGDNSLRHLQIEGSKVPLVVVQDGYKIEDMERHLPAPLRLKQHVTLTSPRGFVSYVSNFKTLATVVFIKDATFTAKLDYHTPGQPSWVSHTATYAPKVSHQWKAWKEHHKLTFTQVEFAEFIEERLGEIVAPAAAVVMTGVLNFKQFADHSVESVLNRRTGELTFKFIKANKVQEVDFPHDLVLRMPIFDYHEPTEIKAELRTNVQDGGNVILSYRFLRDPIDIEREYVEAIAAGIQTALQGLPFFEGSAA